MPDVSFTALTPLAFLGRSAEVFADKTAIVYGDAANPRSQEELESKFRTLASEALGPARVNEVIEMVARLEHLRDVRGLTALL